MRATLSSKSKFTSANANVALRRIQILEPDENLKNHFTSNSISTTKYRLYNSVPKNLFEQFRRLANFWFLAVSIAQMLPYNLSPTSSYSTILPLGMMLCLTMAKDFYEDYKR